ncbi:O-antigen ligase [Filimonas lacunae]|uniref:O-antigen ligase n=1 Tax=Filimonas lacunae TaxID=477680 RepID=A0A173MHJ3_9BACT|nr:O-antigen ligase family protein [Filimonas lacunae]BAV06888.1 oligosaccharide repeat unit polymerase Wzy [Filimonas lacunae]SIS98325.1 O-antigen ligase [Filimonas lacunae]
MLANTPLAENTHQLFLKRTGWMLLLVLVVMVGGYFTWSENVVITRLIKVVGRMGMTLAAIVIHHRIVKRGALASFQWKNHLSPFLYFGYLVLGFISFLWSTDVGYSALQWFMDIEGLLFAFYYIKCLMMLDIYFPGNTIRFYNLMGNTVFLLLSVFVIGMFADPDDFFRLVEGGEDKRLGGYIMNPNELGMISGLGISCLIFDLYRLRKKVWTIVKIVMMAYVLIMTKSRSSLIGLLLIVFFHVRRLQNKVIIYSIYAAVAAVIPVAIEKLVMRKGGLDDVLSMTGRMPFWKALINEGLPREPLLGFGFMRIDYKDKFESVHTYAGHMTHNTFMQVLMNLGFVGLCLVGVQMYFTIRGFLRESEEKKLMLMGILIPVIINSFTEFGIFGETNYGILFYQMLIFSISLQPHQRCTTRELLYLQRKRAGAFAVKPSTT